MASNETRLSRAAATAPSSLGRVSKRDRPGFDGRTLVSYPRGVGLTETGGSCGVYYNNKQDILNRLKRIEGQLRGLQRTVEQDSNCIDVLSQITAANSALKSAVVGLLEDHIGHCVAQGIKAKGAEGKEELVAETGAAISRLVRS